jgi:PHP domain-containing protein
MPLLRGNLHSHTTFSDGIRSPARLVAEYETLGYDFLAITDHDDHENWVEPDYQEALDALSSDMVLFRGVELNYAPLSQHVGKVVGDRETLYVLNHPARYKLTVDETLDRIARIRRAGWPLEAIEVTDTGLYKPLYDRDEIPLVKIATDDAHRPPHFGRAWIEVESRRDPDAIIAAIRAGDFRIAFARHSPP